METKADIIEALFEQESRGAIDRVLERLGLGPVQGLSGDHPLRRSRGQSWLGEGAAPAVDDIRRHHRHTFAQAGWFLTESLMRIGTPEALRTIAEDLHNRHWDATIRSDRLF